MARSPGNTARSRYTEAFTSSIFEPTASPLAPAFVPAGKRRDQTTNEIFGDYDEKDLRSMPKTFVPKEDGLSARQKKLHFLSSGVLPCSSYPPGAEPERQRPAIRLDPMEADEEAVDASQLRHKELSSQLFGRNTPGYSPEQAHDRSARLTPNDFKWHSHPEAVPTRPAAQAMSHSDRAYQEKCSVVFDHQSPQMPGDFHSSHRLTKEEEEADVLRRQNLHYSDLFDRRTPMQSPPSQADGSVRRPRHQGSHEDQIIIHQDWTDSKTELINGARSGRPEHPSLRKSDELHQSRVFGDSGSWQPPERLQAVQHDNSDKLKSTIGRSPQQIHQAHLRTSITPSEFYEDAEGHKHWEVAELYLSGLPSHVDDAWVRNLCQGFDLQIVKAVADMDPVRNYCKGRAKIMVRYNPMRDSIKGLIRKLQDSNLIVEM